jgi:hypothetical protein
MPDKQAGYMTATEFRIASALRPLHAGGVHIWLAERGEFELPVPIREQSEGSPRVVVGQFPRRVPNGVSEKNAEPRSEQTSIH